MGNEAAFFDIVREHLGSLTKSQVTGFETLMAQWEASLLTDERWFGYILATAWHETAKTMQPIEEMGGIKYLKSKPYYPYFGRGYVQLTWKANYEKYGIAATPDKALDPNLAGKIAIDGMVHGIFTGKALKDYFGKKTDAINARRIINGVDKAVEIAGYYSVFVSAINAMNEPEVQPQT